MCFCPESELPCSPGDWERVPWERRSPARRSWPAGTCSRSRRTRSSRRPPGSPGWPGRPIGWCEMTAIVAFSRGTRPTLTLRWVAGAYAGAFFLGAAGVLPGLALLPHTTRQAIGMREGALWSLHPWRLVELVWPGFLGNPTDPRYNLGELVAASGGGALDTSWSLSAYLGAPVLALAALAAVARRPGSRRLWIGVAILLVLALGAYTPVYPLFRACFPPEQARNSGYNAGWAPSA